MRVSLHWGPVDALDVAGRGVDVAVVVDVLSFTTALSVAADRGIEVLPFEWGHDGAAELARVRGATLAVRRGEDGVTLSPGSLRRCTDVTSVVLPSPNGSSISRLLAESGAAVVGGSLRNAQAVAGWVRDLAPGSLAVVAAGERWPDGSLRPAVEDLLGAGAVLSALGTGTLSPGAQAARAAYEEAAGRIGVRLEECPSGRELIEKGWAEDVRIAAELDSSRVVPLLEGDTFRPVSR